MALYFLMSKRLTELPEKETRLIRIPGLLLGIFGILCLPYKLIESQLPLHIGLGGMFLSIMFILYGYGGSKLFLKVFYTTRVRKL
jgi:hypothetical protein